MKFACTYCGRPCWDSVLMVASMPYCSKDCFKLSRQPFMQKRLSEYGFQDPVSGR